MKVRKLTAHWGSKGMGAKVEVWLPDATFQTFETLDSGRKATEVNRAVTDAIREIIRDVFPLSPAHRREQITVEMSAFDDETGERVW